MKIFVTDLDGKEHEVAATAKWTVMEIVRDGDLPMRAECGGCCSCATCHVYVDAEWMGRLTPADSEEIATLDGGFELQPNSRLSCQITFKTELDGLKVTLTKDAAE